ncbi:MAG TPA: multiheme c-type cytochrome [bacterium]|nr:multiheme c-type cytochrome [bacterium]
MAAQRVALAFLGIAVTAVASVACTSHPRSYSLTRAELEDPQTCMSCHPSAYQQWSGSMHAYASEDPVFLAMNARGQRETGGALGSFCVKCHAPLALQEGLTVDGTNLPSLEPKFRGVNCYFCHTIDEVTGDHNAAVHTAEDMTMRGGITNPLYNGVHRAKYDALDDRNTLDSSNACGSCHDVVTGHGARIERTFAEWRATVFDTAGALRQTCGNCHMPGSDGPAAEFPGAPVRRVHDHSMPGIDLALTPFAETSAQTLAVKTFLSNQLYNRLCVVPAGAETDITVRLDNAFAGHDFPSGAAQDRRLWLELRAWSGTSEVFSTGVVPDGTDVTTLADPNLWLFRDQMLDTAGAPTHMFWEAASVMTNLMPSVTTLDQSNPAYYHYREKTFQVFAQPVTKITMRARVIPVGLDVIDDLINSGDLDPSYRGKIPTLDLESTGQTWTPASPVCTVQ